MDFIKKEAVALYLQNPCAIFFFEVQDTSRISSYFRGFQK